jgi:hypothetical protein
VLADQHLLVSEVLLAISAIVGDSVTLLEAAGSALPAKIVTS